jgi:hypothetical protein
MRATCLILVLSLLPLSYVRADEAEEAAAKLVKKLGGKFSREGKEADGPVIVADLSKSEVTDKDLKKLAGLKSLMVLNLYDTAVTNKGLKDVAALKTLEGLDLRATKVEGKGLKELTKLKGLKILFLAKDVPDEDVAQLRKALPKCKIAR